MSVLHWQQFTCGSCASPIAPTNPRVRCLVCTVAYDMCANCILGERFKEPHVGTHAVQVLKQSGGAGGSDQGGEGVATVLGTTAICYYPPPPVPTLPLAVVNEVQVRDRVDVLQDSVAQLSLGPEDTSLGAGSGAGHGHDEDVNGIQLPPVQPPILQDQYHHLDGRDRSPSAQLLEGQPQPDNFLAHNQAVSSQYPAASQQGEDQAVTAVSVPLSYQHAPPVEPPAASVQPTDQHTTTAPDQSTTQNVGPVAPLPADSFQQLHQVPVEAATHPTYQYDAQAASATASSSEPADQLNTAVTPANYRHDPSVASVLPASSQQVHGPQAVLGDSATYPHVAPVVFEALGPSHQLDEPYTAASAPPAYHSPTPVALPARSSLHEPQPSTGASTYTPPVVSPLAGLSQQAEQFPGAVTVPSAHQFGAPVGPSVAGPAAQDQSSADVTATFTHQPTSAAAGYDYPVSQQGSSAAGPPTYQSPAQVASSPATSFQQIDQPAVITAAFSIHPHAAPVSSSTTGYPQPTFQPTSTATVPPAYQSPAQATSTSTIPSQQVDQPAAAPTSSSIYQPKAPAASSPASSFRQVNQPSITAASPPAYPHRIAIASSVESSFQQADRASASTGVPSPYQSTAPVGSPAAGYLQGMVAPPTYQSPVPAIPCAADIFQQGTQPSVAGADSSVYQPAGPVAPSATGYAQPIPQLPAGAAAPSPYQQGFIATHFQQTGRPPSVASVHSGYQYAPQTGPALTGSPSIPPNLIGGPPPALPPRRSTTARPTSYGSPHITPASNLPQYQNGYQASAASGPTGWQPFFLADMSSSPTFVDLLNDVFTYLDQRNLGNLEPETLSGFLDDLGYMPHENAWKSGLQATFALSAQSMADKSLKNAFDLFSIDHILLRRIQPPHEDPTGITAQYKRMLGPAFNPSMLQNAGSAYSTVEGPMPAITRKGFVDLMTLEAKAEPSREWGNWSRLLRKYNLPRYANWGDLPRECFMEYPDPLTMQRVAEIRKIGERKAQEQLDAARAYAQLAAQGRQNALDIVGDTRYEYVYR